MRSMLNKREAHSYDDVTGVIATLGLLSALVLGFIVAMQIEGTPRNQPEGGFRGLLCSSQGFRSFVVETMDTFSGGVGSYSAEPFNFTLPIGGGRTIDMRSQLETGIQERHGEISVRADLPGCLKDPDVATTAEALLSVFPMAMMNVWVIQNDPQTRVSDGVEKPMSFSFGFNFVCLLWSVILYLSISYSSAREDESGNVLASWMVVGTPAIWISYALLFAALICFMIGYARILQWNSPFFDQTFTNVSTIGLVSLTAPGLASGLIIGVVAYVMSWRRGRKLQSELDKAAASEQVHQCEV